MSQTESRTLFETLEATLEERGVEAALETLATGLAREGRFHELFDARLIQYRLELGLPVAGRRDLEALPEPVRGQMEERYLEACGEVGRLLLDAGRVREAWMYLRPAGDREAVAKALDTIDPDEEQFDGMLEVALHEGVAPRRGIELVVERLGTCNAITMFESTAGQWLPRDTAEAATFLVRHLHGELLTNVRADIGRNEGQEPDSSSVEELVRERDWLFSELNYHIDTSHLSAVVRFGRLVEDPEVLRLALDLTEYGRRLVKQYQYPGEPPFEDVYPAHGLFFSAQLGERVDEAVAYFAQRADEADAETEGVGAAETYVALLARLGRAEAALEAALTHLRPGMPTSGFSPTLGELATACGGFQRWVEASRAGGDLMSFATGLIAARQESSGP